MKKYCSECRRPLANPNAIVCDKCGKQTTPIDIFDRLASDNMLSSKEKKILEFIGIMGIIGCVISIIEWLIITIQFGSSAQILTEQWNAGLIEQTPENIAAYQTVKLVANGFVTIGVIVMIEQAAALFLSAMILLKRSWAVQICRVLYIINIVLYFISGNFISAIIVIYIVVKLNGIISKMEGGAEYSRVREENARIAAELAADPTKWQCKNCGFINPTTVSECKSCGRWK